MDNNNLPIIGSGKKGSGPLANFMKEEKVVVPAGIMSEMSVQIPPIYYWEDVYKDKSELMTMAFKIHGRNFGMSYPIDEQNDVKIGILRKKLFGVIKESLDVLVHHGTKVLDHDGNIDPALVNDEEAIRFKHDPYWDKKVAAFNQLVRVAPITRKKAIQMGFLEESKVAL